MDFKFSKDSGDSQQQEAPGEKKSQSALLVLLLILVGGFTYLYFFTGLIKPQEVQKTAEAPAPSPQVVKIPLPPREGDATKPAETPAKPVAATAVKAIPAPTPAPSKPKEDPKKTEAAKPADKKPQPPPVVDKKAEKTAPAKTEEKKTAATAAKPAVADKNSTPAKDGNKKAVSNGQTKPKTVMKAKNTVTDSWSLVVGDYVLGEALSTDMGRVRKAGFEPIVKPSQRKKTTMNRLFVSEFNDRATAQQTMEKLKRHTSDAFVIEERGRFSLYAGSYLHSEAAGSEKERLKAAGFSVIVKHADIAIPSQSLSVGPFGSKNAADSARGKLKNAGIKAELSQN